MSLALRGNLDPADFASLEARTRELGDPDMESALHDLRGALALAEGRFVEAAREQIAFAEGSDLNAPYALPRAGVAAVLGGDAPLAKEIVARLGGLGTRGRAIETDISVIRSGVAALEGDKAAAMAGYRAAWSRYGELGLLYDQGLLALVAAATIGPDDGDVAEWLGEARTIFERLGAAPLLAMVDGYAANVWSGRSVPTRAGDERAAAEAASAEPAS